MPIGKPFAVAPADYRAGAPRATGRGAMLTPLALALGDLRLPAMRAALIGALGLAVLLFALLLAGLGWLFAHAALTGIVWLDWVADLLGGAAALVGAILLFPAATPAILPFFLDGVAAAVEAKHYPGLAEPHPASLFAAGWAGVRLALAALLLNLLALPFVLLLPLFGIGLYLLVNGWLLGREYFELAALRRLDLAGARAARKRCSGRIWAVGIVLAVIGLVPLGNLLVPLLGASAFVHVFHRTAGLAGRFTRV